MRAKHVDHPIFRKPSNENARIWRYMDFTKFISLLENNALFFCRADKLGDRFEGSYSKANVRLRPEVYGGKVPEKILKSLSVSFEKIRRFIIMNCWNLSECESAALWKLYVRSEEGVAVQSTFKRLTQSFSPDGERQVCIGRVNYIDYNTDWLPEGNLFYPFLHKRKSFEHEQELRAIIMINPISTGGEVDLDKEVTDMGEFIDVNMDMLIENVYVAPTAQDWFLNLMTSVMKRYDLKKNLVRSDLASDPVY